MKRVAFGALILLACESATPSTPRGDAASPRDAGARDASARPDAAPKPSATTGVQDVLDGKCASATVQSSLLPSNILFVLDRSGSMACNPPPVTQSTNCEAMPARDREQEPSKWEIVTDALREALVLLPSTATIAVSYFSNDERCGVHDVPRVDFGLNTEAQRSAIDESLRAVVPSGGTPLVGATLLAYKHTHDAALAGDIVGNQFVVLLTDGAQSDDCSDPAQCVDAASCTSLLVDREAARAAGPGSEIRTFVIGAPGSEPARESLSKLARAGKTAREGCDVAHGDCHFDMTRVDDFASELPRALANIAAQTVTCDLPLPVTDEELDFTRVNVVFTSGQTDEALVVPQDANHDCDKDADGWQYNADQTKIRLCGATCERIRGDVGARLEVVLGCPQIYL